jgi:predicted AAA+ superfamily ATPase
VNDLQIKPRHLTATLEQTLREFPVVVVTGARQTGKTTLVQRLLADERAYRTLDDLRVLEMAQREPDVLVAEAERMTLDEVQRVPDLLRAIKRAVDRKRQPGRFLLTGSANLLLMRAASESLAGRATYLRLGPLTESEKAGRSEVPPWRTWLEASDPQRIVRTIADRPVAAGRAWTERACEGGYPPVLSLALTGRARWFDGYIATYLERDLQQLAAIDSLADFRRLIEIAALRLGGVVNQAELGRDAALTRPTTHRYLNLLETSHQLRRLRPFAKTRTARVVKAPKLYWSDTGLVTHMAGFLEPAQLAAAPRRGAFLENLFLCHLDAWVETESPRPSIYYWRTSDGAEVDFVVERGRHLLPLEVKASTTVSRRDAAGIETFLRHHRSARVGAILYLGSEPYALSPRIAVVPLGALL